MTHTNQSWVSQFAVRRPLDKSNLHDNLRTCPMRPPRQSLTFGERRFRDFEFVEAGAKIQEKLRIEAGADLSGEHKVVAVKITYKQRTEAHTTALRIGESTDDEFLRGLAFHLQPIR